MYHGSLRWKKWIVKIILQPTNQPASQPANQPTNQPTSIKLDGYVGWRICWCFCIGDGDASGFVEALVQSALSVEAQFSKPPEASVPPRHQIEMLSSKIAGQLGSMDILSIFYKIIIIIYNNNNKTIIIYLEQLYVRM